MTAFSVGGVATFQPLAACIGGGFIGIACGAYMFFAGRIAGNSGALKAVLLGPREPTKMAFLGGLAVAGLLMKLVLPSCFEALPAPSMSLAAAGLAVGFGTALGNGCTSGHGLCGLSRLSKRSLVAVPTFMVAAMATATVRSGGIIGAPLPMADTPLPTLELAGRLAAGLLAALPPCTLLCVSGASNSRPWYRAVAARCRDTSLPLLTFRVRSLLSAVRVVPSRCMRACGRACVLGSASPSAAWSARAS